MAALLDVCRFTPTLGGTTDWTYSSAVTGYNSPALAGVVNGRTYKYRAESTDLSQWEIGEGAYNTATGVLTRLTVLHNSSGTGTATGQSGAGTKINFSAPPQVAVVAVKEDLLSIEEANSFSATQQAQARSNITATGNLVSYTRYSASATWNRPANCTAILVRAWGGGGGSGGCPSNSGAAVSSSPGGGGAEMRELFIASPSASYVMTIGAGGTAGTAGANAGGVGGDTTFGAVLTAKGGLAGTGGNTGTSIALAGALASPTGSGGVGQPGGAGAPSFGQQAAYALGGNGGGSPCGGGEQAGANAGGTGTTGAAPGGGAGGAASGTLGAAQAGGVGGAGAIDVYVYQ